MHPTGPYRREWVWRLRAAMSEHDIQPMSEERLHEHVDAVADLRD